MILADFFKKTKYDTDKSDLEKKINDAGKKTPNISRIVKKADYNTKISKIEGRIPSITGLDTTAALTAVTNKISDVSNLVKKADYDTKILDFERKYVTASDNNKFTSQTLDAKIKQKRLVDKSAVAGFINNTDLDKKVAALAKKAELKAEQDKTIKLQAFDSSYFCDKSHFEHNGTQNYLVFQPMYRCFKKI